MHCLHWTLVTLPASIATMTCHSASHLPHIAKRSLPTVSILDAHPTGPSPREKPPASILRADAPHPATSRDVSFGGDAARPTSVGDLTTGHCPRSSKRSAFDF